MSAILIFIQHVDGQVQKPTLAAIAAARQLGKVWNVNNFFGVALGAGAEVAAKVVAELGVGKVFYSSDPALERYLATPYEAAVLEAATVSGADTVVAAATSTAKDFMPRVAAVLEAGQASDIVAVNSDGSLRRPMYAGNAFADVEIVTSKKVVTVRATAFSVATAEGSAGVTEPLSLNFSGATAGEVVGYELSKADRPELGDAAVVVSGGRALQSAENFEKIISPLADVLGAAVGASRAAVDAGLVPNDWQVGQTGKVVAPNLYIAVGISGAIQHLAGMKDSKVIVAINNNAEAPIFEVADYGLVGDLFQLVPELTEAIKKVKG